jgi:IS30 family transposase
MNEDLEKGNLSNAEKLLVLGLIKQGLSQAQIAGALGMHRTTLSRHFPKGLLAEISKSEAN